MSDYAKDLAEAERQREALKNLSVPVIWDLIRGGHVDAVGRAICQLEDHEFQSFCLKLDHELAFNGGSFFGRVLGKQEELLKAKPAPKPAKKTPPANKRKRVPAKSPTQAAKKTPAAKLVLKPEKVTVASREGFEAEVLALVDKLKTINVGVVLENVNIARDAASAGLARLVKDGKLVRSGSRRHTSYALKPVLTGWNPVAEPSVGDDEDEGDDE
jgi:hypothetical protein